MISAFQPLGCGERERPAPAGAVGAEWGQPLVSWAALVPLENGSKAAIGAAVVSAHLRVQRHAYARLCTRVRRCTPCDTHRRAHHRDALHRYTYDAICVCAPHVHMCNKHTCQMASHRHVRAERTHVQCRYTKGPSETFTLTGGTPLAAAPKVPPSACGPVGARPPPETWPRAVALTPLTHSLCSLDSATSKMR